MAAPVVMVIFSFSRDRPWTASATEEVVSSTIVSTPSASYHSRAREDAMSALFWWSAETTSIGAPATVPPKSSTAISAAATEPVPPKSA